MAIHFRRKPSPSPHLSGQFLPSLFFKNSPLQRFTFGYVDVAEEKSLEPEDVSKLTIKRAVAYAVSDRLAVKCRVELKLVKVSTRIPKLFFHAFGFINDDDYLACWSEADALFHLLRVIHLVRSFVLLKLDCEVVLVTPLSYNIVASCIVLVKFASSLRPVSEIK